MADRDRLSSSARLIAKHRPPSPPRGAFGVQEREVERQGQGHRHDDAELDGMGRCRCGPRESLSADRADEVGVRAESRDVDVSTMALPEKNWTKARTARSPLPQESRRSSVSSRSRLVMPSAATRATPIQATRLIKPRSADTELHRLDRAGGGDDVTHQDGDGEEAERDPEFTGPPRRVLPIRRLKAHHRKSSTP